MGLFSKFLNGSATAEDAVKAAKGLLGQLGLTQPSPGKPAGQPSERPAASEPLNPAPAPSPSGFSWGEEMPAEENQFNFPGSYRSYFENVFREEFADYSVSVETPRNRDAAVFTFAKDGRKALVVEVMSQTSGARAIRKTCRKSGVPYLRYYHNHHGWWNTRAYVVQRTRGALRG